MFLTKQLLAIVAGILIPALCDLVMSRRTKLVFTTGALVSEHGLSF